MRYDTEREHTAAGFWGLGLALLGRSRRPQPLEDSSLGTRPLGSSAGNDPGSGLSLSSSCSTPCTHEVYC